MCSLALRTATIIVTKCIANCPNKLKNNAGWKIDVNGRTFDSRSNGLDLETDMKDTEPNNPSAVICESPYFTPSKYRTDKEYELIKLWRAKI